MSVRCEILGHDLYRRTIWLGDPGYPVRVMACRRRRCDHLEDVPGSVGKETQS